MLMLLFYIGEERYACECDYILEIIPNVSLTSVTHTQKYVIGVLNYSGAPVPVVDFTLLCEERNSTPYLSTRIVILRREKGGEIQTLGLLTERVTDTITHDLEDFSDSGMHLRNASYLGGVLHDKKGVIHSVLIDQLFDTVNQALEV